MLRTWRAVVSMRRLRRLAHKSPQGGANVRAPREAPESGVDSLAA